VQLVDVVVRSRDEPIKRHGYVEKNLSLRHGDSLQDD
jgi:hypothetical protein